MPRIALLTDWVRSLFAADFPGRQVTIEPASADASFRRYFRAVSYTHLDVYKRQGL